MNAPSAVILSAGKGERLWPLTSTRPKPLLPILCKPLILNHLEALYSKGVREYFIVVHHMEELVKREVSAFFEERRDANVTFVKQGEPRGTGHAVLSVFREAEVPGDRLLVIYGDVYIDVETYSRVLDSFLRDSGEDHVLGVLVNDVSRFGELLVDDYGNLLEIREKPGIARRGIINGGIYLVEKTPLRKALETVRVSERGEYELTDALNKISKITTVKVDVIEHSSWSDIGTPWDYLEINRRIVKERVGRVIIGVGSHVSENSILEGPIYIDQDVTIGPFNRIRGPTVICRGVRIGFSVEVKASVILENSRVPHLSYVGDSVIGEHANLGAGTITANLRHDNESVKTVVKGRLVSTGMRKFGAVIGGYAKTGINTSLLPGVKIGARSWIGAGCIIDRDVPDDSVVKCRCEKTIIDRRDIQ